MKLENKKVKQIYFYLIKGSYFFTICQHVKYIRRIFEIKQL